MLKYVNHDIVFQEFPDQVSLAINLSLCPCRCEGCHSPRLWGDVGDELTTERLCALIDHYGPTITCVGLMGGDNDPARVWTLLSEVRHRYPSLLTGWYSGREALPDACRGLDPPDFVKLGPWRAECGPLSAPTTNQRLLRYDRHGTWTDVTERFWRKT